jgi:hypothetical protein
MDLHFVAPDLRRIDEVRAEAIALACCSDERPLGGPLGLLDWRLSGRLSTLVSRGRFSGALGERCLVAARSSVPFEKVFLFGAGPMRGLGVAPPRLGAARAQHRGEQEAVFRQVTSDMLDTLAAARVRVAALALPGRHLGLVEPAHAMRLLLAVTSGRERHDDLTLVEPIEAQRAMHAVIEEARRRERAGTDG